jgi:hypothetical protein
MTHRVGDAVEYFTAKARETIKSATKYDKTMHELVLYVKRDLAVLRELDKICDEIKKNTRNMDRKKELLDSLVKTGCHMLACFADLKDKSRLQIFHRSAPKIDARARLLHTVSQEYHSSLIDLDNEFIKLVNLHYRTKNAKEKKQIENAVEHLEDISGMEIINERIALINTHRKKGQLLLEIRFESEK